ncbi:DMT family transporter [bacterium]|nr:DMT family transporter [bacterium]
MGVCVKAIGPEVGTPETVFARGLVGGAVGLLLHVALRRKLAMAAPLVMLFRILAGTGSLLCYYAAIEGAVGGKGELATASMLLKTAPLWVALLAGWLLGEPVSGRTWIALLVGLLGLGATLLGPAGVGGRSAVVLGLLAGVFAAFAYLSVRRLATREEPLTVVTLFSLGTAALMAPVVGLRFLSHACDLPGGRAGLLLLGIGVSGTVAQVFMTHAYRHGKAAVVSLSGLAEVAFNVLAGVLLFGERPSPWALAGSGLAVIAGLAASWPSRSSLTS